MIRLLLNKLMIKTKLKNTKHFGQDIISNGLYQVIRNNIGQKDD